MQRVISAMAAQRSLGYALLRAFTAVILFAHGYQKVFYEGLGSVSRMFERMGIILPQVTGPFIGLLELVGGALLFLGLFTRWLGFIFAIEFVVATYTRWILLDKGYFGSELELLILVACIVLATNGAGRYSLDSLFRRADA
jgi:putative oxidoreductase